MTHLLSAPVAKAAHAGSIGGFSVTCSCGFTASTSLSVIFAEQAAADHVRFMTTDAVVKARASQKRVAARLQEGA